MNSDHVNRLFWPEHWSYAETFLKFMGPPFAVTPELQKGTSAVVSHRSKFESVASLANGFMHNLRLDREELERTGYTSGGHARTFAGLIETLVSELYAVLDGLRRVLFSVFRSVRGIQNGSTKTLFERAAKGAYGAQLPAELNEALAQAYRSWFPRLRTIRTEITHGETGTCWVDRDTGRIDYWHPRARAADDDLRIEDVVGFVNATATEVDTLTELVFRTLYTALAPVEHRQLCAIYKGRAYERMVAPGPSLSFSDGRCWSRAWFETEPGYDCPLRESCGAYARPVSREERDAYFNRVGRAS